MRIRWHTKISLIRSGHHLKRTFTVPEQYLALQDFGQDHEISATNQVQTLDPCRSPAAPEHPKMAVLLPTVRDAAQETVRRQRSRVGNDSPLLYHRIKWVGGRDC